MQKAIAGAPSSAYCPGDLISHSINIRSHLFIFQRLPGAVAAEEQSGVPWEMETGLDENGDRDDDDELSLASYTIGGRSLKCHVKRPDEESLSDSEGEEAENIDDDDDGGEFPIEYPDPAMLHGLDGEPCA